MICHCFVRVPIIYSFDVIVEEIRALDKVKYLVQ